MKHLHKFYAWVFGYFWLPCPQCGCMFGGHQIGNGLLEGMCCCKRCDIYQAR